MSKAFLYLSGLIASLFISLLISIPVSSWIAKKIGAIDYPGNLTIHERPTPRLGGLGILFSWILIISGFMIIYRFYDSRILILLLGIIFLIIVGIIDDIHGIKQSPKFVICLLLSFGVSWLIIDVKLWWIFTLASIFMFGMINALNFIDGMDGLAVGLAIIIYFGFFILFTLDKSLLFSFISISCAGACLGFLPFNWNPARIFMGDVGSMIIGFSIAGLSVVFLENGSWAFNRILAIILIAAIPLGDLIFTFIRRIIFRKTLNLRKLFLGDRNHYYDQMQSNSKLNTKKIVIISYIIGVFFAILGITSLFLKGIWSACLGIAGIFLLITLGKLFKIGIPKSARI